MTDKQKMLDVNHRDRDRRLMAVGRLSLLQDDGRLAFPPAGEDVNSHIHTIYSFSPYSPAAAVLKSKEAGLATCGIMDHDSVSGAKEFTLAGEALGIKTTVGCEIRTSFKGTFLENERINNPDQKGIAYVALHGIPERSLAAVDQFLQPIREARGRRNEKMAEKIAALLSPHGISYTYDEVKDLSQAAEGGSVTERHLFYAVALKLKEKATLEKRPLSEMTEEVLGLTLNDKQRGMLDDENSPHLLYDLLGIMKSDLTARVYVDATDELPDIRDVVRFAKANGILLAYPYLGDIGESVTGDKKAQAFEDAYLDRLLPLLVDLGFEVITFMPSRNTAEQLDRLMALAKKYDLFQVSGEDINQSRQSFVCEAMRDAKFDHLKRAAHALIGHEKAANKNLSHGFLSDEMKAAYPDLDARIAYFSGLS